MSLPAFQASNTYQSSMAVAGLPHASAIHRNPIVISGHCSGEQCSLSSHQDVFKFWPGSGHWQYLAFVASCCPNKRYQKVQKPTTLPVAGTSSCQPCRAPTRSNHRCQDTLNCCLARERAVLSNSDASAFTPACYTLALYTLHPGPCQPSPSFEILSNLGQALKPVS